MTILDSLYEALRIPAMADAARRERAMRGRLVGCGFSDVCGRCGGSGSYSYNSMDGTKCYGCMGAGKHARKPNKALLAEVQEYVAAGKLDAYLIELAARQAAERACKDATKRVLDAWKATGVDAAYNWRNASDEAAHPRDFFISRNFNRPMCEAFEAVQAASNAVDSLVFARYHARTPLTAEELAALTAKIDAGRVELAAKTDAALALIQRLGAELVEYVKEAA